jgi:hypothetical protein
MRALALRGIVVLSLAGVVVSAQSDQPSLSEVLKAAGEYVAGFERNASLAAEEDYSQLVENTRRTLHSDILFIPDETFGWVEFRDVAASDGIPVRDRQERLLALFTKPNPNRLEQAQRIVAEGARFNLNPRGMRLNRTINLPLTAIRFLRPASQHRSSFRIARWNRESGIVSLEFSEQYRPRLINTPDQSAANGRFEIERTTGRVTASTLLLQSGNILATIAVKFAADQKLGKWLPLTMAEQYRGLGIVTGEAKYSAYRQFRVETSEAVKH